MLLLGMISKKIRKWCQTCKTLIHGRDVPVCAVQSIILDLWFARDLSGVHHPPLVKTYWRSRSTAVSWKGSACGIPGAAPEKKAYKFYTLRLMILNKMFNFGVNTESQALRRAWSRIPQNMWVYSVYSLHAVQWHLRVFDQLHFASRLTSVLRAGTKVNHWTSPEEFAPLTISCGITVHTLISSGWSRTDSDLLWRWCDERVGTVLSQIWSKLRGRLRPPALAPDATNAKASKHQ